jgi:putative addiction module CopG family antidote
MEVQLSEDQAAFVRQAIKDGRFLREEDALREALLLWEKQERRRAEIMAALDETEASFASGEGRILKTHADVVQLSSEIKQRGLARLAAEKNL